MSPIVICIALFVVMLVLFFTNKIPMSFTALAAMVAGALRMPGQQCGHCHIWQQHGHHHGLHVRSGRGTDPDPDDQ